MLAYALRRILMMIPTLIGVAILIFILVRVVPGDFVAQKYGVVGGAQVSQEVIDAERARLGLDQPYLVQLGDWLWGLARLDLGTSLWTERPVLTEIGERFQLTLQTAIMGTLVAVVIAIPLGTISAIYNGTWLDQLIRILTIGGIAIPSFWLGMLILLFLLTVFTWAPPLTFKPIYEDPGANLSLLIWPALSIGYRLASLIARMVRSSLLEVMNEDYIRTARAKGVKEALVVRRHALRNALLPAITVIGIEFALLIGGLVLTEQVFNLNGVGRLFVDAVSRNDYMMIQGLVMVTAVFFMLVNLIVDLIYAALDPRVDMH
ncbi:MAG: ABC transporter permease [Maritimibacter sp.]|nr:ABC transporter permease [Maritimibacter sp.]